MLLEVLAPWETDTLLLRAALVQQVGSFTPLLPSLPRLPRIALHCMRRLLTCRAYQPSYLQALDCPPLTTFPLFIPPFLKFRKAAQFAAIDAKIKAHEELRRSRKCRADMCTQALERLQKANNDAKLMPEGPRKTAEMARIKTEWQRHNAEATRCIQDEEGANPPGCSALPRLCFAFLDAKSLNNPLISHHPCSSSEPCAASQGGAGLDRESGAGLHTDR